MAAINVTCDRGHQSPGYRSWVFREKQVFAHDDFTKWSLSRSQKAELTAEVSRHSRAATLAAATCTSSLVVH
jgi:hypothetical protein